MPRQSSGTYQQPANTSATSGATISSTAYNTLTSDIANELTNSLDRSGRGGMSAALSMGGNKITGMADPSASTDGATKNYVDTQGALFGTKAGIQNGTYIVPTVGGASDAITGAFTPTITSLTDGLTVQVRATASNTTTTPSFQADSTAAKTIVKGAGTALLVGDIAGVGHRLSLTYDSGLDKWVLNNPANAVVRSPTTSKVTNLIVTNNNSTPNTKIDISADEATLLNSQGFAVQHLSVSLTIDSTTTGANGCDTVTRGANTSYDIYLISNGTTVAGLLVIEGNSPAMPSGYTYKKKVSWQHTDGSSNFRTIRQRDKYGQYTGIAPTMDTGPRGSITAGSVVWGAISFVGYLPTGASDISVTFGASNASNAILAPNNSYDGFNANSNAPPFEAANQYLTATFVPESTSVYWATNGGFSSLRAFGFSLPI